MMTFSSRSKEALLDLVKESTEKYWGKRTTLFIPLDDILRATKKVNLLYSVDDAVIVEYSDNRRPDPNFVGWTLRDVSAWFEQIKYGSRYRHDQIMWRLQVPDPYTKPVKVTVRRVYL